MERRDINNHGEERGERMGGGEIIRFAGFSQQPYVETVASFRWVDGWAVPTWSGGSRSLD